MSAPVAYSYVRFSTPDQAKGDSLRRQVEATDRYCSRRGLTLSPLTLRDLGVSAFRGKNALVGNLGTFLSAIDRGMVAPGSVLIVESIDRISRQGIDEGYEIIKKILKSGVILVTLTPEREFGADAVKSITKGALELQLILERAAEESQTKSERISHAWGEKRKRLREKGELATRQLPGWIEAVDGKPALIPDRAAAVKRIFALSGSGYSQTSIVRKLTEEGHAPFGEYKVGEGRSRSARAGKWVRAYVAKILRDRRTLGECQPRGKDRKPDGEPIPDYYPAVIGQAEWDRARAGARQRQGFDKRPDGTFKGRRRGRQGATGDGTNLFQGLLRNARDGGTYYVARRPNGGHLLINTAASETGTRAAAFSYAPFERAILSHLREIDPAEIIGPPQGADEMTALSVELEGVRANRAAIEGDLSRAYSAALANVLRAVEAREQELDRRLSEAWARAATPASESWREAKGLLAALGSAEDKEDARLRLKSALRRVIDSIWLLVVPRGKFVRFCEAQVHYADGAFRSFTILHRTASGNQLTTRPPVTWVRTIKHPDGAISGLPFNMEDLRDRDQAGNVEQFLERYPKGLIDRFLAEAEREAEANAE